MLANLRGRLASLQRCTLCVPTGTDPAVAMPMPRHIRLRQHTRIRKPARVAGLFDFQLHEARVKPGIIKVSVDRRGLKREAASTISQFVNTFVPQLRYWNPTVPVTLVDGKVDKAPEAAVVITHGEFANPAPPKGT